MFDKMIFNEETARSIIYPVLRGLAYMHSQGIIHRDIKPENIMLSLNVKSLVQIIDFGLAFQQKKGQQAKGTVGSAFYVAPEILEQQPYDEKCDLWSTGVVMFCLIAGELPFNDDERQVMFSKIKKGEFNLEPSIWAQVSDECKDLLNMLLCTDPAKRISARDALEHPWFKCENDDHSMESTSSSSRAKSLSTNADSQ